MRITKISAVTCNAQMRNWVFVRVETDVPGLVGWGEATLEWKTRSVVGAIADLEPLLVGLDPRDIEQCLSYESSRLPDDWKPLPATPTMAGSGGGWIAMCWVDKDRLGV